LTASLKTAKANAFVGTGLAFGGGVTKKSMLLRYFKAGRVEGFFDEAEPLG
jgi:hypothetical protein